MCVHLSDYLAMSNAHSVFFFTDTPSMTSMKPVITSIHDTPTTALSVAISHSPPPTHNGGSGSDEVSSNSHIIVVGVAGALLVLVSAPVIIIAVLVCLRRRNDKLNTTKNVAYVSTLLDSLKTNEMYNDVTNEVTDIHILASTNHTYLEISKSGSTSDVIAATNQASLEVRNNGHTSSTDIPTSTNKTYLKDGPIYEDADIPASINQVYPIKEVSSVKVAVVYTLIYSTLPRAVGYILRHQSGQG